MRCATHDHAHARDITTTWCVDLQPILDLNRQRRLHGPTFASIYQLGSTDKTRLNFLVDVWKVLI